MEQITALFLQHLAAPVLTIVAGVLGVLGVWVLSKLRTILGVRETEELAHAWHRIVSAGVRYAEHRAKQFAKANGEESPSQTKLGWALEWIEGEADEHGLALVARDRLERLIEAKLGGDRYV